MNSLFLDRKMADDDRRAQVYQGQLFLYSATPALSEFVQFARGLIEDTFAGFDPTTAQHEMPVEEYVALLSDLKPKFIHHSESKRHLQNILRDMGCDPTQTFFDVPRMRTSTSDGYLTSGIAYAFHPHRDTWYSAPMCQINWWIPIYEVASDNVMAFHPEYFSQPVANSSDTYNYQQWVATSRQNAAKHVGKDTRQQPKALEELRPEPQLRVVAPPGSMLLFSASHLHSSVENTSGVTRFSIDFRTVHLADLEEGRGAANIDSRCTGSTLGDYLRLSDLEHVPQSVIEKDMAGVI